MNTRIAWTDYPILELGDMSRQEAPIRRVELLAWDRNKYVTVRLIDEPDTPLTEFKAGYLYEKPGRLGEVPEVSHESWEELPWEFP